jgi:hypothetical protein
MTVTADNKLSIIGTKNGILKNSNNGYIWSGIVPSRVLSDYF